MRIFDCIIKNQFEITIGINHTQTRLNFLPLHSFFNPIHLAFDNYENLDVVFDRHWLHSPAEHLKIHRHLEQKEDPLDSSADENKLNND